MVEFHRFIKFEEDEVLGDLSDYNKPCDRCDEGTLHYGREVIQNETESGDIMTVEELSEGLRCDKCGYVEPG